MPSRPPTPRRLTATALLVLLAVTTATGCKDGQGVRDEGPAADRAAAVTAGENQKAARD
ncbi:hypothetical protein [Streptomyces sp. NPDC093990]|uniref:hypothetical protein n=1 Tax=Streptomyces sp. NPDC093990 TaxID=3155306 RepID=UPI00341D10DE